MVYEKFFEYIYKVSFKYVFCLFLKFKYFNENYRL